MSKLLLAICITALILSSCTSGTSKGATNEKFLVEIDSLPIDALIRSAVYFQGRLICLKEGEKFLVLNEDLQPDTSLSEQLNRIQPNHLFIYRDTVVVAGDKQFYYLDRGLALKPLQANQALFKYGYPFYADDTYNVTGCSVGEFGSTLSFLNRKTGAYYSAPSNAIQQVLKYKGKYIASCYLAHMGGFSNITVVEDPQQLYSLKSTYARQHCNWFVVDSLVKAEGIKLDTALPKGMYQYFKDDGVAILATFIYKDDLYTLFTQDSVTLLGKHVNNSIAVIDTLRKSRINFQHAVTNQLGDGSLTAYSYEWGTLKDDRVVTYKNTGIIVIRGNSIRFIDLYGIPIKEE